MLLFTNNIKLSRVFIFIINKPTLLNTYNNNKHITYK